MQDGSTGACLACPLSSVTAGSKCALPAARRHEARLTAPRHESQGRGAWGVEEEGFGWATVFIHVRQLCGVICRAWCHTAQSWLQDLILVADLNRGVRWLKVKRKSPEICCRGERRSAGALPLHWIPCP